VQNMITNGAAAHKHVAVAAIAAPVLMHGGSGAAFPPVPAPTAAGTATVSASLPPAPDAASTQAVVTRARRLLAQRALAEGSTCRRSPALRQPTARALLDRRRGATGSPATVPVRVSATRNLKKFEKQKTRNRRFGKQFKVAHRSASM
jgi:hypothetical protein